MKSNSKNRRVFFALALSGEVQQQLHRVACALPLKQGRAVAPENYHITLKFVGSVGEHELDQLCDCVTPPQIRPFELAITRVGYWPKNEILFAVPEDANQTIKKIARHIERCLHASPFQTKKEKRFHPHITLYRDAQWHDTLVQDFCITAKFAQFVLLESIMTRQGVYYRGLESWPLYTPSVKEQLLGLS